MLFFIIIALFCNGCNQVTNVQQSENNQSGSGKSVNVENKTENSFSNTQLLENSNSSNQPKIAENQPKTVREFFNLLPQKYFPLEGCEPKIDNNCEKARAEYIKTFLEIEDTKNGYWKSGCDGAQTCLTMALFKRPDSTYLVHLLTEFEMGEDSFFLEFKNGQWTDLSTKIIPEFNTKYSYIPPRQGTTVEVFQKDFSEPNFSERGKKLYDLIWNEGKFSIRK